MWTANTCSDLPCTEDQIESSFLTLTDSTSDTASTVSLATEDDVTEPFFGVLRTKDPKLQLVQQDSSEEHTKNLASLREVAFV